MNLDKGEMVGARESTDTIRVEGTRRSVYLATSRDAPIESRDLPRLRAALEIATTTLDPMEAMVFQD